MAVIVICVDTSVAAKWVLEEPDSDLATSLYTDAIDADQAIYATPLIRFEVANVIRRRMLARGLPLPEAHRIFAQFLRFDVQLLMPDGIFPRALAIVSELAIPAIYDATYIALAESLGCDYWTADGKIHRVVSHRYPFVRLLDTYIPASSPSDPQTTST